MKSLSFTPLARQDLEEIHDYLLLYRDHPDHLEIVRVLHGARDIESLFME